jgi:excisionase family DNA binding protein
MSTEFIDTYDAAAEIGVSRPTLYRLIEQRGVKKYKIPGQRRTQIRRADLEILKAPQELGVRVSREEAPSGA